MEDLAAIVVCSPAGHKHNLTSNCPLSRSQAIYARPEHAQCAVQ